MAKSKVVIVHNSRIQGSKGIVPPSQIKTMFSRGISLLTDLKETSESLRVIFRDGEKIGIKINTLGGNKISTKPETSLSLAETLLLSGNQKKNIIIWDRTNRELKNAGYRLNVRGNGFRIFGTDTNGIQYGTQLVSHLNIGSMFSNIQTRLIQSSISLAVLKDHGLAGVSGGMKNYYGAIHNPNKYHDFNCNPFVAEVFDCTPIKKSHKLTILDALTVQYHRGPSYHAKWAQNYGAFIFSFDPVAADYVGWKIIEKLRADNSLPSLKEEQREPVYLKTAHGMGLGKNSEEEIIIIEEEI
ncbi:DUF362 domain-containing protein [Acidobacteriota bacterium]